MTKNELLGRYASLKETVSAAEKELKGLKEKIVAAGSHSTADWVAVVETQIQRRMDNDMVKELLGDNVPMKDTPVVKVTVRAKN